VKASGSSERNTKTVLTPTGLMEGVRDRLDVHMSYHALRALRVRSGRLIRAVRHYFVRRSLKS
jgi:hypothetical protein